MSQRGVINPYTAHVHPYPTRYHGGMYARPVFDLPYKRNPHAVFKPNDFYSFYGVQGLGSFGRSSLGNGSIGGNTLGLGATGAPIYWLASSTNPKVTALQQGINKVLVSHGYLPIPVTGRLEGRTCGALAILARDHREDLLTQIPNDIVHEAANTCTAAVRQGGQLVAPERNPNPPTPLVSPTEPVGPGTIVETAPQPQPQPVPQAPPTPVVVQPEIYEPEPEPAIPEGPEPTYITISEDMPEMQVEARPAAQTTGKSGLWVLAALGGAGILYFALRKKKD